MAQQKSPVDRATHTVADLTGRSDAEVKLLLGVTAVGVGVGVAVAATLKTVEVLMNLGAAFGRRAAGNR